MERLEERARKGTAIFVDTLNELGVEYIFGHTGGTVLSVYAEINERMVRKTKTPKVIMYRDEEGAGHAAEGYARVSGKPCVVVATSGPGSTKILTPLADAYADSVPVIFVTGQVGTNVIGNDAFQEVPTTQMGCLRSKHSYLVKECDHIGSTLRQAHRIATTGRQGPVLIDICKDAFMNTSADGYEESELPGYNVHDRLDEKQADKLLAELVRAEKPLVYGGGGIVSSNSSEVFRQFVEKYDLPVGLTFMALGALDSSHRLFSGMLGMHGNVAALYAAADTDFVLAIGARFDDRVFVKDFGEKAKFGHVDIDPSEIGKNKKIDFPVECDAFNFLKYAVENGPDNFQNLENWHMQIEEWRKENPVYDKTSKNVKPQEVIETISRLASSDAVVTTGVGQHQMWTAQYYKFSKPRRFISSGGLGTMGFGLPAAIGAYFAEPSTQIICIDGDGSFQMNIQELATAVDNEIPIKIFIMNNGFLGMPRQWEDQFFGGNHFETCLYRTKSCAPECRDIKDCRRLSPDFLGFKYSNPGLLTERITQPSEIESVVKRALSSDKPYLVDVWIDRSENVFPIIPPGKGIRDMVLK